MKPNNFCYFSTLDAYLWLPTQFLLQCPLHGKGMKYKVMNSSPIYQQTIKCFLFFLSSVSIFYLRSYWIMCTGFYLISPIILAYMHSLSNYKNNGYASFSLWTYYKHLAEFKWSWRNLLICYQHLFTNSILPLSVPWKSYISWKYIPEPASCAG